MRSPETRSTGPIGDRGDASSRGDAMRSLPGHAAREQGPAERDLTGFFRSLDAVWDVALRRGHFRLTLPESRRAIATMAAEARACGLRPEQFLWMVKESWAAQPEVRTAADPIATRETLSRLITVCIHEFYRE